MSRVTIGIVSAGAMGSAVGAAYAGGGARAVTSVQGRSERTRALAAAAGLELLAGLDEVVRVSDIVLSIVPPERARAVAGDIAAAARHADADPLVADLNAVAPATVRAMQALYAGSGLELVDGSISGGPPRPDGSTRLYLSGARAAELEALAAPGLDARVVGGTVGLASAVKMSTASVYKGTVGLLAHALLAAHANGVLPHVLDDLRASFPELVDGSARSIARATTKAGRYVGEMREIAATQAEAGLPRELFDGFAALYAALAETPLAQQSPESIRAELGLEELLEALNAGGAGRDVVEGSPRRS
jgi:3-hydroxyisobutyrate dehydrogenase-like beta-hydroxyacid dehydrogenase